MPAAARSAHHDHDHDDHGHGHDHDDHEDHEDHGHSHQPCGSSSSGRLPKYVPISTEPDDETLESSAARGGSSPRAHGKGQRLGGKSDSSASLRSRGSANGGSHGHGNGHGHGHGHGHDDHHDGEHNDYERHEGRDHNMWGLFIHFLGDVLTSLLVLGVGLAYYFDPPPDHLAPGDSARRYWVNYLDPGASVVSVAIIMLSAWPLVKACSWILLQSSPAHLDLSKLRRDILKVTHIEGMHELHVWQLVDGLSIASVHVVVARAAVLEATVQAVKAVLHRHGIHSSTIQPEFSPLTDDIARGHAKSPMAGVCVLPSGSCVKDCAEEPCCPVANPDPLQTTWP